MGSPASKQCVWVFWRCLSPGREGEFSQPLEVFEYGNNQSLRFQIMVSIRRRFVPKV